LQSQLTFIFFTVLTVLQDNYQNLCQCLSSDYVITLSRLKGVFRYERSYDNTLSYLSTLPTVEKINQTIVDTLLERVTGNSGILIVCDIINELVDNIASRKFLQFLRHGEHMAILLKYINYLLFLEFLEALSSPFMSNGSSSSQLQINSNVQHHGGSSNNRVAGYTQTVSTHHASTVQPSLSLPSTNTAASVGKGDIL